MLQISLGNRTIISVLVRDIEGALRPGRQPIYKHAPYIFFFFYRIDTNYLKIIGNYEISDRMKFLHFMKKCIHKIQ